MVTSAVSLNLFLQPKPRIDYTLKAVGGSLTALPGISDMIDVSFDILILSRIDFYITWTD